MNCDEYCANHGCNRGPNCPAGEKVTLIKNSYPVEKNDDIETPHWVVGLAAIVIVGLAAFCSGVIVDHWGSL